MYYAKLIIYMYLRIISSYAMFGMLRLVESFKLTIVHFANIYHQCEQN